MKLIGLLGGMSWESTALYYRWINQGVRERCGGLHSARLLLHSVDFEQIARLQRCDDWEGAGAVLCDAARSLERAGAELLLICSNTMHEVAPQMEMRCKVPLLHVADVTARAIARSQHQIHTIGLLATRFTCERQFYVGRLRERHGLQVLVPDVADRELVHRAIFEELCMGRIEANTRSEFQRIIAQLAARGAQAVVFGCTEITLLLQAHDVELPVFDTAQLHAAAAVAHALDE